MTADWRALDGAATAGPWRVGKRQRRTDPVPVFAGVGGAVYRVADFTDEPSAVQAVHLRNRSAELRALRDAAREVAEYLRCAAPVTEIDTADCTRCRACRLRSSLRALDEVRDA